MTILTSAYCMDITSMQAKELGTDEYINEIETYISNDLDINIKDEFTNVLTGDTSNIKKSILDYILDIFGKEIKENCILIVKILVIVIITGILSNVSNSFGKSQVSNIAFFTSYISIILLVMTSFNNILSVITNAISTLSSFMYATVPILFSLILSTGNFVTANMFQPILLGTIQVLTVMLNTILIPLVLIFTVVNIVSNLSEREQLKNLSDLIKNSTIWILGLAITIVVGIMSLEGSLGSSIDGFTGKTVKTAVTSFIPVVGKALGDAVETVMGSTIVLKNSVGIIGVMVILAIGIFPIIKTSILLGLFSLTTAVIEPIADTRVIKCMGYISDSLKLLLAILITVLFIYIVSITLIIKVSNFSIMMN